MLERGVCWGWRSRALLFPRTVPAPCPEESGVKSSEGPGYILEVDAIPAVQVGLRPSTVMAKPRPFQGAAVLA